MTELLVMLAIFIVVSAAYSVGHYDGKKGNVALVTKANLKTAEMKCKVVVLSHEVDSYNGLWATDQPRLIKYHKEKEMFFRIGYPKDRL